MLTDPRGISGAFLPLSVAKKLDPGAVPEGTQAFPGTRGTAAARAENPVDAFWNQRPSALPLTAEGAKAIEGFDGGSTDNPRLRCEPTSILFDWTFDGPVNRITQNRDTIVIEYGQMNLRRTVHMNMKTHPANIKPSRAGHSIGRWEGDVLVVDTVGFAPGVLVAPVRHGGKLHVVERFTLDPKTMKMTRSYVAEDPEYLKGQYSGSDTIGIADQPFTKDNCSDQTLVDFSKQK